MKTPLLQIGFKSDDAFADDNIDFDAMELQLDEVEIENIEAAIQFMKEHPKMSCVHIHVTEIQFYNEGVPVETGWRYDVAALYVYDSGCCYLNLQSKYNSSNTVEFDGFVTNDLIEE